MTDVSVPYKFKSEHTYVNDFGVASNFNLSLKPPSDLDDTEIDKILACLAAERRERASVPCSERGLIKPRKIRFIRDNGNSFTLVFADRSKLIEQGKCVWDILNAKKDVKPICAILMGEKHKDVVDDYAPKDRTGETITDKPIVPPGDTSANSKYRLNYNGTIKDYETDAAYGSKILMPFRSQTDKAGEPYSQLKDAIMKCHGELATASLSCGATSKTRDYRRFIPHVAVKISAKIVEEGQQANFIEALQTLTVPIAKHLPTDIIACAKELAKFKWVTCLEYHGESNQKFHKLIASK